MNSNFVSFYNEILDISQKYSNAGLDLQSVYGALSAAKNHIGFVMHEDFKKNAILREWEETKTSIGANKPITVPVGETPVIPVTEEN
jgi:hypothetical protein